MPVVALLTTGRCGTQWLTAGIRDLHPGVAIEHEPIGARYSPRRFFRRWDDPSAVLEVPEVARHVERIAREEHYVETGWPLFAALPLLAERFADRLRVVHLTRHPVPTALSHLAHSSYAGSGRDDEYTRLATLGPDDANVFHPEYADRWASLSEYEKCLFWWTEVSLFGLEFEERAPRIPFLRVKSEDVLAGSALPELLDFIGLRWDERWRERTSRTVDRWHHHTDRDVDPLLVRDHAATVDAARRLGYDVDDVDLDALEQRYRGRPDLGLPFLWGAATSAHQVEGGNSGNDWHDWERRPGTNCAEPSGAACDHVNRYAEDIALLADAGLNCYRFSVEWSRVEPEPGRFDADWLAHYGRMLDACRAHGLVPVLTLHHFTNPRWVAAGGGWENPRTAELFARYCERVVDAIGDRAGLVITINEPNMPALLGYEDGVHPPGKRDRAARLREDVFLEATAGDDFVGVNAYTRHRIGPEGWLWPDADAELTATGWEFWPEAVGATLRRAWELTRRPLIATESGVATDADERRIEYIDRAVASAQAAQFDGVDVRGYLYWSALDNFEWQLGYGPKFGLIAVDRATQARTVKPSLRHLGRIAGR